MDHAFFGFYLKKKGEIANRSHVFERLLICWKTKVNSSLFISNNDIFSVAYLHTIIYDKRINIIWRLPLINKVI